MRRASLGRTLWRPSPSWQTTTRWAPPGGLWLGRGLRAVGGWVDSCLYLAGLALASGQLWAAL